MISIIPKMKILSKSKSKPADVWCLDSLGENLVKFDRLSLCSQIKAIPIEDVVAMLTEIQTEIEELDTYDVERTHGLIENAYISEEVDNIIQQKINELKGGNI